MLATPQEQVKATDQPVEEKSDAKAKSDSGQPALPQVDDVEIITTDQPAEYSGIINDMIARLSEKVQIPDDQEEEESPHAPASSKVSLLSLVKDFSRGDSDEEEDVGATDPSLFPLVEEGQGLTKGFILEIGLKTAEGCDEMMKLPVLKCLFRCMARECAYATNSPHEFMAHLMADHGEGKQDGWLSCSHCLTRMASPHCLALHCIKMHGKTDSVWKRYIYISVKHCQS